MAGSDGVWALVPVKSFARAKSRLAPILDDAERAAFARRMFEHVLGALADSGVVDKTVVVTDGADVAQAARALGADAIEDGCVGPLGKIVDGALAALALQGARAALIVMGDLPDLRADDIRQMVALVADSDVVIAPDAAGEGTSALGLRPARAMATCFGRRDSFTQHADAARAVGLRSAVHRSPSLAFDVDAPEDYRAWIKRTTSRPRADS